MTIAYFSSKLQRVSFLSLFYFVSYISYMNVKVIVNEKGTAEAEKLFFILLHGFQ